jgi:glucokinase
MQPVVAVDLGGTNLRAAFYPQGIPPAKRTLRIPSRAERGPEAVLAAMEEAIREVLPDPFPAGLSVGVAAPGPMDPNAGVVLSAPNLPGWINVPLRGWLEDALAVPVRIGNDANLAALGEWRYGAGQGVNHLIYLAISTGIGGGAISDGHLIVGWRGLGVEPGHMPMVEDGPLCGCGTRGHLEALASGTAIARRAAELLAEGHPSSLRQTGSSPLDAESVSAAAESGDALARRVLREAGEALGRALAGLVHIFNPQRIILGGGVARAGESLWEPVRRTLQAEVMNPAFLEGVDLVPAALGDDAGLVGALVLATLP